jgi:hypothetical protein
MVQGVSAKRTKPEEIQPPPPPPPPPPPQAAPTAPTNEVQGAASPAARPSLDTRLSSAQRFNVESGGAQRAAAIQGQFTAQHAAPAPASGTQPAAPAPTQTNDPVTTEQTGPNQYRLTAGSDSVDVTVGNGVDPNSVVPKAAQYYGQTPSEVRGAIDEIEFKAEKGPAIATTDDPNDAAAAQAGGGKITFFEGAKHLNQEIFDHEAAHLAGGARENQEDGLLENITELGGILERGDPAPAGYVEAAKKDGNFTSAYAEDSHSATGYTEDFAEGYRGYRAAVAQGPQAVEAFRSQYPNRTAWLEENYPA